MSFEELSFRNLVEWHREDLIKILNGARVTDVFTSQHISRLVKKGVIHRVPTLRCSLPTPKAMVLLESEKDDNHNQ